MNTIKKVDLKDKIVLLRTDYNVTIDVHGKIIDDIRVKATLPTLKYLMKHAKKIIIVGHLGRPIIQAKASMQRIIAGNQGIILKPVANDLAKRLKIDFCDKDAQFDDFVLPFYKLNDKIWLMENIRFCPEEEANDDSFAKTLANLADVYVDDAFGNIHRAHASMVGVTKYLPSYAGLLLTREIETLSMLMKKPPKPFVLISGGAKVSEKILTLEKLVKKADKILLGGIMANTFLASRDIDMKKSAVEKDSIEKASELYALAAKKFYLPNDLIWRSFAAVDIGKTTIRQFEQIIAKAETVFWNGTMGLTSVGNFKYAHGTHAIIKAVANSQAKNKIICGGDTIAEVSKMKLINKMTFVSTGGGAALSFLAGDVLPGIEALEENTKMKFEKSK